MGGTFDTAEITSALPDGHGTAITEGLGAATASDNKIILQDGWVKPLEYDYTQLSNQGPDAPRDWEGNAPVYQWDEEYGDVGPEHAQLEEMLFGPVENRGTELTGIAYHTIDSIEVRQRGDEPIVPIKTFEDAGLHPVMLRNVQLCGYKAPTPIQRYTIPAIREGFDLVAVAQTGSGKTASYLVPILDKLMGKAKRLAAPRPNPAKYIPGVTPTVRAEPLVVVVCPSRELAVQIFNEARKFCYRTMLRPCVAYGGGPIREQIEQLGKGCDVLIASPGRLCDFIQRPGVLTLRRLRYLVIDEADEMLQDDWGEELRTIMSGGEQEEGNVKYMLFSATFPKDLRDLAREQLATTHKQINVGRIGSSHGNILQRVIEVEPEQKKQQAIRTIETVPPGRTIIFVNSKRTADELDDFLFNMGFPCTSMHSDRTQLEREAAMRAFRAGKSPILIATGVSARGIDVRNVVHVINYDLPSIEHGGIEEYTHRIGRTGRIGHKGLATSFYNADRDESLASVLVRTLLETNQDVPDFLQPFMPEGDDLENLKWETNSNPEDRPEGGGGGSGSAFGGDAGDGSGGGAWGAEGGEAAGNAWGGNGDGGGGWGSGPANNADGAADTADAGAGWGMPANGHAETESGW